MTTESVSSETNETAGSLTSKKPLKLDGRKPRVRVGEVNHKYRSELRRKRARAAKSRERRGLPTPVALHYEFQSHLRRERHKARRAAEAARWKAIAAEREQDCLKLPDAEMEFAQQVQRPDRTPVFMQRSNWARHLGREMRRRGFRWQVQAGKVVLTKIGAPLTPPAHVA